MKKFQIIAHRGGFLPEGPIPQVRDKYTIPENTLGAFKRALENGWGIETDVRLTENGQFVLSHDDNVNQTLVTVPTLDELCQLAPPFVAFQIKRGGNQESGGVKIGRAVAQGIRQYGLKKSILFDATLEEAQVLHREIPWLNLSVSMGEDNYSPTIYTPQQVLSSDFTSVFSSVWADEWKISRSIYNEEMFKKLRNAYSGRVDVISPELHYNENHPLSHDLERLKKLWKELISWQVDGICTDYPTTLKLVL